MPRRSLPDPQGGTKTERALGRRARLGSLAAVALVAGGAALGAGCAEARARALAPTVVRDPGRPPLEGTVFARSDSLAARLDKLTAHLGPKATAPRRIVIDKSERRMDLFAGEALVRRYVVNLGRDPAGDKVREGDGCTPEGDFYVCTRGPSKAFHRFLGLSYPNSEDAARGLTGGLIGKTAYARIAEAIGRRAKPSWSTPLGGAIGIHGSGVRAPVPGGWAIVDWTAGCIAVTDSEIQEIYEQFVTKTGVAVRIEK